MYCFVIRWKVERISLLQHDYRTAVVQSWRGLTSTSVIICVILLASYCCSYGHSSLMLLCFDKGVWSAHTHTKDGLHHRQMSIVHSLHSTHHSWGEKARTIRSCVTVSTVDFCRNALICCKFAANCNIYSQIFGADYAKHERNNI